MRIEPTIVARPLHEAAVDQVLHQLGAEGWTVERDVLLGAGRQRADILARRDGEVVVYEVKSPNYAGDRAEDVAQAAREIGAGFRLVLVRPPRQIRAEVKGIEGVLAAALSNPLKDDLALLSDRTVVEDVGNVEINEIEVHGTEIGVQGSGTASLTLTAEGGSVELDQLVLPFTFHLALGPDRLPISVVRFEIDTSSWYGESNDGSVLGRPIARETRVLGNF